MIRKFFEENQEIFLSYEQYHHFIQQCYQFYNHCIASVSDQTMEQLQRDSLFMQYIEDRLGHNYIPFKTFLTPLFINCPYKPIISPMSVTQISSAPYQCLSCKYCGHLMFQTTRLSCGCYVCNQCVLDNFLSPDKSHIAPFCTLCLKIIVSSTQQEGQNLFTQSQLYFSCPFYCEGCDFIGRITEIQQHLLICYYYKQSIQNQLSSQFNEFALMEQQQIITQLKQQRDQHIQLIKHLKKILELNLPVFQHNSLQQDIALIELQIQKLVRQKTDLIHENSEHLETIVKLQQIQEANTQLLQSSLEYSRSNLSSRGSFSKSFTVDLSQLNNGVKPHRKRLFQ